MLNIATKNNVHKEQENNFHSDSVNQNNSFWAYHETLIHTKNKTIYFF